MAKDNQQPRVHTKKHIARLERERRQTAAILYIAIGAIVFVVLLLGYGYINLNYLQLQKPVAEVNGVAITVKHWQERVSIQRLNLLNQLNLYQQYQQVFGMDTTQQQQQITSQLSLPEIIGQQVLDQMVDEIIIQQEAKKRGITVTDQEVEDVIRGAYNFYPNGTPTPTITPTEIAFPTLSPAQLLLVTPTSSVKPTETATATLEATATLSAPVTATPTFTAAPPTPTFVPALPSATPTPYTLEGYKSQYTKQLDQLKKYNISEATFREIYRANLYTDKLVKIIGADVATTEEQVWARHILVQDSATAQKVRLSLLQGQDFATAAKESSKDTGSAEKGGDLGWFGKGQMVPEFEKAAFSQKIGEIGLPVQSQFGFHIIQVIGHQNIPLNDQQIQQARQTAFQDWLKKSRESAKITKHDDNWKNQVPTEPSLLSQTQP